jgi:hypothetical protein
LQSQGSAVFTVEKKENLIDPFAHVDKQFASENLFESKGGLNDLSK